VAEELAAMPEVDYVVITAGTYDLLVETVCEDNESLLRFLAERLRAIEGVRETETFVYLRLVKQSYQWGVR
jgi:Lrp/AsnC family transcriptional regulator for asnA, asnC and gidA